MKTIHRKQSGSSLVIVISVLATLMVIVGIAAEYTWTVNRHVQRSNTQQTAIAVGDSCVEIMFANWRKICSTNPTQTQTTNSFSMLQIPLPTYAQLNLPNVTKFALRGSNVDPADDDEYDKTYTISNYKVIAVTPEWTTLGAASTAPMPSLGQTSGPPTPTTTVAYNYIASADVTLPALGKDGNVVARVRRVFQKQQMSPWNFAIFYVDPLEIHPGPDFTVTGWVHTNSDLYTGHESLTFADKVTYGSDWSIGFNPLDHTHGGDVPASPHYPGNLPPARDQAMQPFGLDANSIWNTSDANQNNDSYHELIEPTNTSYTDPLAGQRYWDQADIIIQVADNPNASAPGFDGVNGHDLVKFYSVNPATGVTTQITSSSTGDDLALYNMFNVKDGSGHPLAIKTNETIYDGREDTTVRLATLDISTLETTSGSGCNANTPCWTKQASLTSFNGIIYIYNPSATSTARRGIRLKNGDTIPKNGLTVASNNPVYIQGDFNVGPGTVPSNSQTNNDPTQPQSAGYTRAPTSVVADAVTILSNNWNDANGDNSSKPLTGRVASNTTVNTAIISGIVPSGGYVPVNGVSPQDGAYSGGAENFPRFLEAWDNKKFTYYGSMVELYQSKQAIGEWTYGGNVYGAPDRQWYFDNNFKIKPPPGSLMLYSYIKGKWSVL
jgi:hypothetical protein